MVGSVNLATVWDLVSNVPVFSAPAGMTRLHFGPRSKEGRVPRTRGDDPWRI